MNDGQSERTHHGVSGVLARRRLDVRLVHTDERVRAAGIDEEGVGRRGRADANLDGVVRELVHRDEVRALLRAALAMADVLEELRARLVLLDDLGRASVGDTPREGERDGGVADDEGGRRGGGRGGAESKEGGETGHQSKERKGGRSFDGDVLLRTMVLYASCVAVVSASRSYGKCLNEGSGGARARTITAGGFGASEASEPQHKRAAKGRALGA